MAIPLVNASLLAALHDCDQPASEFTNIYLQRRVYANPEPSAPYSLSDVMGSVACIQDARSGTNYTSSASFQALYNSGAVTNYTRTIDPDKGGTCTHEFTRIANKGDGGLIDRHLGLLPSSGRCRVQFETYEKSSKAAPKVEVVGSTNGWLAGGNKYYVVAEYLNNGSHVFDFDIDPAYPYLSVNNMTIVYNANNSASGTGKFRYIKAFLI